MFVVVMVFPNGDGRVAVTSNLTPALRQWARRHGDFLPVAAFQVSAGGLSLVKDMLGHQHLPWTAELASVAQATSRAPLEPAAVRPVCVHIRRLGAKAGPLLRAWQQAVSG